MSVDMQNIHNKKILITGGGSGGHLSSAQALIDAMLDMYMIPIENIIYVGGDLGMEGEKDSGSLEQKQMKGKGFKTIYIRAGKLQRAISLNTILLLLRTILGFLDSIKILLSEKPDLVISTGGFVSVPVCIVSWILGKPIFLHEQTATVGLSNKIVGHLSKRVYVSFKASTKHFSKGKALHVGNNVRKAIFLKKETPKTDQEIVKLFKEKGPQKVIYISGGSLGSHTLNRKVLSELDSLLEKYRIILQTGDNQKLRDYDLVISQTSKLTEEKKQNIVVRKYIDQENIGYVLNNMDIFLGRSGANTVYEIGVLKKNALFVPIPWVTHNEQYLNAKVLEELGTAKILEEKHLEETTLLKELSLFEEQIKLRDVKLDEIDEIFPLNATNRMLDDIFSNIS